MTEPALVLGRVEALLAVRREDEAVVALQRLLAVEPDDARAWRWLAYALDRLGDHRAALDAANRALVLDPEDEWGHRLASGALASLRRWLPAVTAAQESVRLDPDNWLGHAHLAHALLDRAVNAPLLLSNRSIVRAARQAADRAVALAPDQPGAHYGRARLAQRLRRPKEARAGYRRVLELDPEHVAAITALGELERTLSGAANLFGSALRAEPRAAAARYDLRAVGFRVLLGYGLLALLMAAGEVFAGLTVGAPPYPPIGWLRPVIVVAGLVVVALPALLVGRRLDRPLRTYLLRLPLTNRWVGVWAVALAGVWLALLVLPVLPTPGRVLAVQIAVALSVPGFFVPAFVVAVPLARRRIQLGA